MAPRLHISAAYPEISRHLEAHLPQLLEMGDKVHYGQGQILFYQGHMPYGVFLLKKGDLSWQPDDTAGNRQKRDHCEQDRLIGLRHLLSDTPYCQTCHAQTDIEAIFLSKHAILHYLDAHPFSLK